jgi:hypothetical protein
VPRRWRAEDPIDEQRAARAQQEAHNVRRSSFEKRLAIIMPSFPA